MLSENQFRKLPIFFTTMSRWDGDISSASLALAKVFSRTNKVYYLDYPYTWMDLWRERKDPRVVHRMPALLHGREVLTQVTGQPANLQGATPPPMFPINMLQPGSLYNRLSHLNNQRLASFVNRLIKEENIGPYLFINSFNPTYLSGIRRYLDPVLSIYHCRDAIAEINAYTRRHGSYKEQECVQEYDMTMATSKRLVANLQPYCHRPVNYFPNGGDVTLFQTAMDENLPMPAELMGLRRPIIGYTGAVCQRIDYELLRTLSRSFPEATLILVGPREDHLHAPYKLDELPNVVLTGARKLHELPAYLRHFDVAIIPFKCNALTAGIYPLKINEYLAAGRAVVTTNFSEDIAGFAAEVALVDSHDEFVQAVRKAFSLQSPELQQQRLNAAAINAWENRVEQFWQIAWDSYHQKMTT